MQRGSILSKILIIEDDAGLAAMEAWMREIGCVMSIAELGANESNLDAIADATFFMEGGYHVLNRDEVLDILRASLAAK